MELKWLPKTTLALQFPMCERIVFDFESGIASIQLIADNNILNTVNIDDLTDRDDFGLLPTMIYQNNIVKRTLKKFFQLFWQSSLPYTSNELSLEKFVLMTRFIDFPRNFYEAIPIAENSKRLDESFLSIADELHNPICAIKLLEKSHLPNAKSVKRLFAEKSGLFFYLEECSFLFDLLGDLNFLCRILNSEEAYRIVSMLHSFPGIKTFYKDYCDIKSKKSLCSLLVKNSNAVNNQAIRYCALSTFGKRAEQVKWQENRRIVEQDLMYGTCLNAGFSTPMHAVPEHISNCTIDRFNFRWLRTKNDYMEAGERLDNCLVSWSYYNNPVVGVYKGRKIIAAMEVGDNHIRQAYRKHNTIIDENSSLYSAIEKWCAKYSIGIMNDEYC